MTMYNMVWYHICQIAEVFLALDAWLKKVSRLFLFHVLLDSANKSYTAKKKANGLKKCTFYYVHSMKNCNFRLLNIKKLPA